MRIREVHISAWGGFRGARVPEKVPNPWTNRFLEIYFMAPDPRYKVSSQLIGRRLRYWLSTK